MGEREENEGIWNGEGGKKRNWINLELKGKRKETVEKKEKINDWREEQRVKGKEKERIMAKTGKGKETLENKQTNEYR